MKPVIISFLAILVLSACEDRFIHDGKTVAHGVVVDDITQKPVEGIKLEIEMCSGMSYQYRDCHSTPVYDITSASGKFYIEFGDAPKKNFLLSIPYEMRNRIVIPEEFKQGRNSIEPLKEGKTNPFVIRVTRYRQLEISLSTGMAYDSLASWYGNTFHSFSFNAPLDTTLNYSGLPLSAYWLHIQLWSGGSQIVADSSYIKLTTDDTTFTLRNYP